MLSLVTSAKAIEHHEQALEIFEANGATIF